MRVVLKPISHPDLGEIVIEDGLFAVGRREQPFSSLEGAASQLSRRHARIFIESGVAYVVDLGSTNGTQVGGCALGSEPARLSDGDEVVFGGQLTFAAEIVEEDADDATVFAEVPAVRLVLTPESAELDPLVIENFPFLVARKDNWIQRYEEQFPEDVKEISRRHAIVMLKGSRIYVEDLDSANGTYVSGSRLDELARALNDGDTLSFGTSRFAYRIQLEHLDDDGTVFASGIDGEVTASRGPSTAADAEKTGASAAPVSDMVSAVHDNPKTIYLNSDPTSFVNEVYGDQPDELTVDEPETGGVAGGPVGRLAKARAVSRGLGEALQTDSRDGRRIWMGVLAFVAVLGGVIGTNYWLSADRRQVETLLDDGAYTASAFAANAYLEDHPNDQELDSWGARAIVNAVVPEWLRLVEAGEFQAAADWVNSARERHPHLRTGAELLSVLEWASRLEAHMGERAQGPLSLFEAEPVVRGIVADWDADTYANRRRIGQLADYVPAFRPAEVRLMSALRALQNDSSLYLSAISELRSAVATRLEVGATEDIGLLIREFEVSFPEVQGTEKLHADLRRYEALEQLVRKRDLLGIQEFRRSVEFTTAIFSQHVDAWLDELLSPREVVVGFERANELWRTGELDEALAAYQALTETDWGDVAVSDIDRMQGIVDGYSRLQADRDSPEYTHRLLEYWQQLKPGRDDYFIQALQSDIVPQEQAMLASLERAAGVARAQWNAYSGDGGIPGVLRLQQSLTETFRVQATRLANAVVAIIQATDGFQLLEAQTPAAWLTLRAEIVNEIVRQRRALEDLKRVMEPALVDSKLNLMPQVREVSP